MSESIKDQVFICYAHEDLETVRKIVQGLRNRNIKVWFDKADLNPGRWRAQIVKAINRSRFFLICISIAALRKTGDKPGFTDNELEMAYEIAMAQPEHEFTIVPIRIEECKAKDFRISSFQQYDLFPDFESALDALAFRLGGLSIADSITPDEEKYDKLIVESLLGRFASCFYAKDYERALQLISSIIEIDNDNIEALNNKAATLNALGQYEQAIETCKIIYAKEPDFSTAFTNKGAALFSLGRYEEALHA